MAEKNIPKREQIEDRFKWSLEAIYQNNQLWENDFNKVKEFTEEINNFEGKISKSPSDLLKCLRLQDSLSELFGKLFVYARMRKDEDNTNNTYQALSDRASSLGVFLTSATSFIVPEILSISDEELESFFANEKGLAHYKQFIDEVIRNKPHILSQEQEQLLADAGEIAQAPDSIFAMLNNADIKFPIILDENNEEVELTKGRYTKFMESSNRRVRKDAFEAMYNTYASLNNTFAAILNSNVKKNMFYSKVRKYDSSLEASLFEDNIPKAVYTQLIDTVHDNIGLMHRYVKLRKKLLGVDELHMYDLYTPIVKDINIKVSYEEAQAKVIESLKPLGDDYLSNIKKAFDSRWIDVYENEGKTSGAYSWGSYATDPYILLNYQGSINDMFTLTHELGHSMHSYYSNKTQPYTYAQYKIFVAEVASTLNEALLMDFVLKTTEDKKEKLYYLNYYLEQFRTTVYRQTMFAEFEKMIHEKVEAEEALTPDLLNEMYHDLNKFYYGSEIVVDELIDYEWARIPHFYMDFYVYKYATGFSAATSLARQILDEDDIAVNRYVEFLKSGGSDYPLNLLKKAGVDMNSKEPIQRALDVFSDLLDQMEVLIQI